MNFIFVSPQFPHTYWEFCHRLKQNGVTVLGIGDTPYESLSNELKGSLDDWYYVPNMEDYDRMYRAVAFLASKWGRIDWIESNNEYWLAQDARLRTDFNVRTGIQTDHIDAIKEKSEMKRYYALAGVPSARQIKAAEGEEAVRAFAEKTGYPVFAKPDIGVGANGTYKIDDSAALSAFFRDEREWQHYVVEEFVSGDIASYDAIVGQGGEPLFESMTMWPPSVADIVKGHLDLSYYVSPVMPEQLRERGRATVKAFGVFNRFVHLEFFVLGADRPGLGRKGDYVGLEVNMRPAGGYTPDMINFSHSIDVYKIWADMVAYGKSDVRPGEQYYCAFASRRDEHRYRHTHEEILSRYGKDMVMCERMQGIMVSAMGEQMYTVRLKTFDEMTEFDRFVHERES
ncbi:MAG: hypothetical protein SOW06_10705 [Succinivibrionaceae bacterium]|jgi:hypothetical protein|nr:hypothetical protein [Succinivibrionaceae bacterium]MCI6199086.1 carbamoylphosphate synthase large subunit [Pseudomonadota bacterium]MDY3145822.1 hypothetical protein [Succinivibrionaceae bacterium]MDY6336602.1 hypothetical protein [Succinivibrionaceae bacterium]